MSGTDAPFRKLLRWYPRSWRASNGEVFVATLVEAAAHDGRTRQASADVWSAAVHGTGARLTARLARVLSIAALSLSVVAGLMSTWMPGALAGVGLSFVMPLITGGIVPLLVAISAAAVMRDRGVIGDGRALVMVAIAAPALILAALSAWAWSRGFDAADAGTVAPPLAQAWLPLLVAGLIVGAGLLTLFLEPLLARTSLPRTGRILLSSVAACILAPLVGYALLMPLAAACAALATTIVAAAPRRAATSAAPPRAHADPRPPTQPATLATIRLLAVISVLGGAFGVAYALTGATWSHGASDGTAAMAQGITMLLVAAVPLIAAFGVWVERRGTAPSRHVWGPLALLVGSLALVAAAYTHSPEWDGMLGWLFAGSALAGGAISWWMLPRTRLPRAAAATISVFAGLLYAAFLGVLLTPLLLFTVPILGAFMLFATRTTVMDAVAPRREVLGSQA